MELHFECLAEMNNQDNPNPVIPGDTDSKDKSGDKPAGDIDNKDNDAAKSVKPVNQTTNTTGTISIGYTRTHITI
jgi:hypothetical protein